MEQHAARALHQRLDHHRRDPVSLRRQHPVQRRLAGIVARQVDDGMPRQHARQQRVHALLRVAHRHRRLRVAVVAAAERQQPRAPALPAVEPVLQRHLARHLDRHRAALGEEHALEVARQQRRQPLGQPQGRLVHQPAQHHVRHPAELPRHRVADVRVVVAVAGGPPGGDAVDQHPAVGQPDPAPVGPGCPKRRMRGPHLGVGKPEVAGA